MTTACLIRGDSAPIERKGNVMAKALSKMNKSELYAELKATRATSAPAPKGTSARIFKNIAGVECANPFLANLSSGRIKRHLNGTCGCRTSASSKCAAVKRYGHTRATFGSDPKATFKPYPIA